jgi:4-amino-4-deoxy-L-arabinose transferase-like glycosyltransferase
VIPFAAVALVAVLRLIEVGSYAWARHPMTFTTVAGLSFSFLAAAIVAARVAPLTRPSPAAIAGTMAFLIGARITAAVLAPAPLINDWERYHRIAVDIAASGPRFDVIPTGYPMVLGAVYRLFGSDPAYGQALQVVLASLAGALLYLLVRRSWGDRVALVALLTYAAAPSQIFIGTVLASEPLYTTLLLAAVTALVVAPRLVGALAAGIALGLSQYVRATSMVLAPILMLVAWRPDTTTRSWRVPAAMMISFLVVLGPVVAWNLQTTGSPSISTSRVGNFSLMIGLNQASDGRWNAPDFMTVGGEYGTEQSERVAGEIALDRVTSDPVGTVGLAVRKFAAWGREDYGAFWAIGVEQPNSATMVGASLASQAWWVIVTLLAVAGTVRGGGGHWLTMLTVLMVLGVTATHVLLEAQGRYHSYLVPLLSAIAAFGLASLVGRGRVDASEEG